MDRKGLETDPQTETMDVRILLCRMKQVWNLHYQLWLVVTTRLLTGGSIADPPLSYKLNTIWKLTHSLQQKILNQPTANNILFREFIN